MTEILRGYGDERYGQDFYGSGQYQGVGGRDIALYFPLQNGGVDLSNPITYIPSAEQLASGAKVSELTSAGERFMPDINKLDPDVLHRTYLKVWVVNRNPLFDFLSPVVAVDPATNPGSMVQLAESIPGKAMPSDGDYINVQGGGGAGDFADAPLAIGPSIPAGGAASFWIRRDVVVKYANQRLLTHGISISGSTEVSA